MNHHLQIKKLAPIILNNTMFRQKMIANFIKY